MSYMGVDVGTSGCKAVVFDEQGRQVALAYREYPISSPQPGWAELDAEQVLAACLAVIAEANAGSSGDPVRALGIASQGEAFAPVDAHGQALAPVAITSDTRATKIAADWCAAHGRNRLYEITGHTAQPLFTLFKLLWLRAHQPEIWKRTKKFLCFEDLLQARLGLSPAIGWSLAGRTLLFDVRKHAWDPQLLDEVGLGPEHFARPAPSGAVVGTLSSATAQQLGFTGKVTVVAAGHDQVCAALGAGVVRAGEAIYATGTVECIASALPEPTFSRELCDNNLCCYDSALPGLYMNLAYSLTGGNILKWFRDQFGAQEKDAAARSGANAYSLLLEQLCPETTELLVLPHFTTTGTPYFDTEARGAILNLRLGSTRGKVLRALLEGVAFEMRLNLELLRRSGIVIHELRATGGGARNPAWNQLKADAIGTPITALAVTEAGCLGTALLAAAATTGTPACELAQAWVQTGRVYTPNPERRAWYSEHFSRYQKLYPALRALR